MKNILLVCGGRSFEHEVSLRSAKFVYTSLVSAGYGVVLVRMSKSNTRHHISCHELDTDSLQEGIGVEIMIRPGTGTVTIQGKEISIDVLFPINHGQTGEDGTIQGVAKILWVPCVGPGVFSSVQCFHKHLTKLILQHNDIKVAQGIVVYKNQKIPSYESVVEQLGDILFIKPSAAGSSVGVSKVSNPEEFQLAIKIAFEIDSVILIEKAVQGREIEFSVIGNGDESFVSLAGEIQSQDRYSYEEKYTDASTTNCSIIHDIDLDTLKEYQKIIKNVYHILGCTGMARVDGFLTEKGEFIVNEVNTIPGFTSISMFPKMLEASGVDAKTLMKKLINSAM